MKNSFIILVALVCIFNNNTLLQAQAKKQDDLGPYKDCGRCGVNCISCTVCEDKEMKKNCKEFLCDDAGNCEEKLKSGNHTSDIFKADAVADAVFQQPDKPSPAGNHIATNALGIKTFNRGRTKASITKPDALKNGLNIIAMGKGKTLEVVRHKGTITQMYAVSNGVKSPDLIADIKTAQMHSGGGLNYTCGVFMCECRGDDDCNNLFSTNACGGDAWCDSTTGKCYCITFPTH